MLLVDRTSGNEILVLETGLIAEGVAFQTWTPDCRYLIGGVRQNDLAATVVWDTSINVISLAATRLTVLASQR